jgi:hypothetical protein
MFGAPRCVIGLRNEGRRVGELIMNLPPTLRGGGRGCDEGGTRPRGPPLPRPRRNGCNRTRCRGTPDCRRPDGRTPSVHRSRRTPWLSWPLPRVEGARRAVSLSVTRCFDMLARRRGEKWTRAPGEQARSGVGMEKLDVLAPGAGAGRTRVEVDPADRREIGVRHRHSSRSCVPHRHRLFGVATDSVERPILPWPLGPIPAM